MGRMGGPRAGLDRIEDLPVPTTLQPSRHGGTGALSSYYNRSASWKNLYLTLERKNRPTEMTARRMPDRGPTCLEDLLRRMPRGLSQQRVQPMLLDEDMAMRVFDFAPLFRSTVGFDRLANLLETVSRVDETTVSYPPYDIEKLGNDNYRITMAVAGFTMDNLEIVQTENVLVVSGKGAETKANFLHKGIGARAFERRFQLADHVKVEGASLENGLLRIDLVREIPEAVKPRKIAIGASASEPKAIEQKAA
jgi:molecular chaperone IbpA